MSDIVKADDKVQYWNRWYGVLSLSGIFGLRRGPQFGGLAPVTKDISF
jgi:hypothetical protein